MQVYNKIKRFLYLNTYAELLLSIGVGISVIPLYKISYYLIIVQVVVDIISIRGAVGIFSSWKSKKRSYKILIEKNKKSFHPESFRDYMEAPCGRLLTKLVLNDLNMCENYKTLKQSYPIAFFRDISNCKRFSTEVHFNEKYQPNL